MHASLQTPPHRACRLVTAESHPVTLHMFARPLQATAPGGYRPHSMKCCPAGPWRRSMRTLRSSLWHLAALHRSTRPS